MVGLCVCNPRIQSAMRRSYARLIRRWKCTFLFVVCVIVIWTLSRNTTVVEKSMQKHVVNDLAVDLDLDPLEEGCFYNNRDERDGAWMRICPERNSGIPMRLNSTETVYPLILGVGPAKTGSSALFRILRRHPEVAMADASAAGYACCGSETYFFTKRWPSERHFENYSSYFSNAVEANPNVLYLAEKTPKYHDSHVARARMRTLLDPSSTVLLFTLRDPVEAHISLFFHRHASLREENRLSLDTFFDWSEGALNDYVTWSQCWSSMTRQYPCDDRGQSCLPILTTIWDSCMKTSRYPEGISQYKYSRNLPAWETELADFRILCVPQRSLRDHCEETISGILDEIHLHAGNITELCDETVFQPHVSRRDLLVGLPNLTRDDVEDIDDYLEYLDKRLAVDKKAMDAFCTKYPPYYSQTSALAEDTQEDDLTSFDHISVV